MKKTRTEEDDKRSIDIADDLKFDASHLSRLKDIINPRKRQAQTTLLKRLGELLGDSILDYELTFTSKEESVPEPEPKKGTKKKFGDETVEEAKEKYKDKKVKLIEIVKGDNDTLDYYVMIDDEMDILTKAEYEAITGKGDKVLIKKNMDLFKIADEILSIKSPYTFGNDKEKYNKKIADLLGAKVEDGHIVKYGDVAGSIREAQKAGDLFPTPYKCLDNKDYRRSISEAVSILEPSAGLGYILNYIRALNPASKMTAIEFYLPLLDTLRKMNPDVDFNPDKTNNFLKYNPSNPDFDLIYMNPPFTHKGQTYESYIEGKNAGKELNLNVGKEKDSGYYYNFLFHSLYILNKSNAKSERILNIIVPRLAKDDKKGGIDLLAIVKEAGKPKIRDLLKKYGFKDLSDKEYKSFLDGESIWDDFEDLFSFMQANYIGECEGFSGTGTRAGMYQLIIGRRNYKGSGKSASGKSASDLQLHAVVIDKKMPKKEADLHARHILNKKKLIGRETSNSYRYENINKKYFVPTSYRTKKVNNNISLIFGKPK